MVDEKVPIVLINRENPGIDRDDEYFLFMPGDMDDNVESLMKDLGMEVPNIVRNYPPGGEEKVQENKNLSENNK